MIAGGAEDPNRNVMDRFSLDQMMRIATLPPERIEELRCSALATWIDTNAPKQTLALPAGKATELAAAVAAAVANDAAIPKDLATEFVGAATAELDGLGSEPSETKRGEMMAVLAQPCQPLFSVARAGAPFKLHPYADRSVVSPNLASCYGFYRAAAAWSLPEDAAKLLQQADRVAQQAMKGKEGTSRTAIETALASEAARAIAAKRMDSEQEMMRLILCQSFLDGSAAP